MFANEFSSKLFDGLCPILDLPFGRGDDSDGSQSEGCFPRARRPSYGNKPVLGKLKRHSLKYSRGAWGILD